MRPNPSRQVLEVLLDRAGRRPRMHVLPVLAVVLAAQRDLRAADADAEKGITVAHSSMAASYTGGGVVVLEDPELLDHTADAMNWVRVDGWTPGAACAATIALISRYLQTVLAAVLVAVAFAWWAGVAVLLAALTIRFGYTRPWRSSCSR
jgi:hypothetical protein